MNRLILICSLIFTLPAYAENTDSNRPSREALEAALQSCATTATKDSEGRPDRAAIDQCMSAKGFKKPEGGPRGGPGRGPRPDGPPPKSVSTSGSAL